MYKKRIVPCYHVQYETRLLGTKKKPLFLRTAVVLYPGPETQTRVLSECRKEKRGWISRMLILYGTLTMLRNGYEQNSLVDKGDNDLLCHQTLRSRTFWQTNDVISTISSWGQNVKQDQVYYGDRYLYVWSGSKIILFSWDICLEHLKSRIDLDATSLVQLGRSRK